MFHSYHVEGYFDEMLQKGQRAERTLQTVP